jgi:Fe-S-cluster-containing dehydrogenase component
MKTAHQKVLIYDPERCTGCGYCEIVCAFQHYGTFNPAKSHIRISFDERGGRFEATNCRHCEEPVCLASCPEEAIIKSDESGWVKINPMKCIGCRSCILACPLSCPWFDEEHRVSAKCDFCDGDPACAKYCSPGALRVVSRAEAEEFNKRMYAMEGGRSDRT